MSILIGIGVVTMVTTVYLGKKGWQALHKAVGITPGVLTYRDDNAPLTLSIVSWQQLHLNKKHLKHLPEQQLRQLQRIDEKTHNYQTYQKELETQNKQPVVTEQQFVLHKMLHTRLPEMLASYHQLANIHTSAQHMSNEKKAEASELLQKVLNNIEQLLDRLLEQIETQQLQALQIMNHYIDSHDD
ncbi:hypothetical protein DVY93_04935 [Psychrobacter sp. CCUG 69069]|uniref:hypothetical protein n=1 Tax=Psychrobacter sp. CCUG 69069 TaxID=2282777 RepID=UPI001E532EFD|nr:hypothetical protein [Psychrobacter sp. CCUG 69069]MCD1279101.1 hypothetical protein [Psychrobacter sp. CCUG 69069]